MPETTTAPARAAGVRVATVLAVACAVVVGVLERWWVASNHLGTLTSDGAVVGLMALHLLHHGQLPAYMWGQSYGGGDEAMLTAGAFWAFGTSTGTLLATTALTSALATLAMWWAARPVVGARAALFAALAWWTWSSLFLWRSLKPGGTYLVAMALAWVAVGLVARARAGDRRTTTLVAAGVFAGLAVWSSPMSLQLLVPTALWAWAWLRGLGVRRLGLLVASSAVGAAPALWFGATHGFSNLVVPGGHGGALLGAPERVVQFFWLELPIAVTGRVEGSFAWVLGPYGVTVSLAALVGFVLTARAVRRGRADRCRLPVLAGCSLVVLFALNEDASVKGQGRYVLLGASMVALLVGIALDNAPGALARWRAGRGSWLPGPLVRAGIVWTTSIALLAGVGYVAIREEPPGLIASFPVGGTARMPFDDAPLRALLAERHVTDAYAAYWIAYRVTFETREHVAVVPLETNRYPPLSEAVAASPHPAYLFVARSPDFPRFVAWCAAHHVEVRVARSGEFAVVQPATRVLPAEVPTSVLH